MVDPLVVKGAMTVAAVVSKEAVKRIREYLDRHTQDMLEAEAAERVRWRTERLHRLAERVEGLEVACGANSALAADLLARVNHLLADKEFFRIERNYEFEAVREATEERRRMLAFAAAWTVDLELSIAQLARVERTIRELDPLDVLTLRRLADVEGPWVAEGRPAGSIELDCYHEDLHDYWVSLRPAGEVLLAAGCVALGPGQPKGHKSPAALGLTEMGRNVLRVLDGYIRSNAPDDASKEPTP